MFPALNRLRGAGETGNNGDFGWQRGADEHVGGGFSQAGGAIANGVAVWDGSSWATLGSGMDGGAYALAVEDSGLYAGGDFALAGNKPSSYIAHWYNVPPDGPRIFLPLVVRGG